MTSYILIAAALGLVASAGAWIARNDPDAEARRERYDR
jgi:hypothetical protein